MKHFLLIISIFNAYYICECEELASFYGSSYISVPLNEASARNDIQFRFRTWLSDAIFLLVADQTDFCLIQLDAGSVKLRINLGAGEEEISSPNDVKFNDGQWHHVRVLREEANLTMEVDQLHRVRKRLPGEFFELNIKYEMFVGGNGHFKEQFLGHMVGLRGCIADLFYAGSNILQHVRRRQGTSKVHGVTWNCAAEFNSDVKTDLNFVEDNAYVLLVHPTGRGGARWHFEIKTTSNKSMILYNTGISVDSHLIAVQIISGQLMVLINSPRSTKITNKVFIADNKWHKVVVQFTPRLLELTVGTVVETVKINGAKVLDISDAYFIGGIELTQRTRALSRGVLTADSNFLGCVKGLTVNGEPVGLPSAKSTLGIKTGSCLAEKYSNKSASALEILSVNTLHAIEGGSVHLAQNTIHLIVDYHRWGLREASVLFQVIGSQHGRIITNNGTITDRFSLLDIYMGKISYFHDGSETLEDTIQIEMKLGDHLISALPLYLQKMYTFEIPVKVKPENDAPIILTGIMRVAKGTRRLLTTEILNGTDSDSKSSEIIYTVVDSKSKSAKSSVRNGKFEYIDQPKKSIYMFSQRDIDNGLVLFTYYAENHISNENVTSELIIINVTDGKSPVQTIVLHVALYDLEMKLRFTKGLFLVHNTSALIQQKDLSFTANVVDEYVTSNIRIDVMEQPQYGAIECERDKRYWDVCDWFLTGEINQKHVRYRHSIGAPKCDEFKFRASVNKIHTSTLYNFTITFVKLKLEQLNLNNVYINSSTEFLITIDSLQYQTIPILASNKNIKYSVTEISKYGDIMFASSDNIQKLQVDDTFTQNDVEKEHLKYVLHQRTYSKLVDSITFTVSAKNCEDVSGQLKLIYTPGLELTEKIQVTNIPIQVIEGERANIGVTNLYLEMKSIEYLTYNITKKPIYGTIQICSDKNCTGFKCANQQISCINTTEFTSDDIYRLNVFYMHDDSETRIDNFQFTAWSIKHDFQYVGDFQIDVILKNDNAPKRAIDKVFQVVLEHAKLLTGNDLKYTDADVNTTPRDILYTCTIPNGAIYNIARPTEKITTFTQADLDNNVILFKHHGEDYGKAALWVADGQFYEQGDLEILASKPFVKIVTADIVVRNGASVVIDSHMLNVETNLNIGSKDIMYRILKYPTIGFIQINFLNNKQEFTQEDINSDRVLYVHNTSSVHADHFVIRVSCEDTVAERRLDIKVLPAVYWQRLVTLSSNKTLMVDESTSATISRTYIEVLHPEIPPNEIMYYIILQPKYGYLKLTTNEHNADVKSFDQFTINNGQLQYIQNVANQTHDKIIFDVSNGITWLRNMVLKIQIIPEHFYIETKSLNVSEGQSVVITKDTLKVITEYYEGLIVEYSLIRLPKHGFIQIGGSREHVRKFSERDLVKGLVKYMHDSSENFEDSFTVVGHAGLKESEPTKLSVNIVALNDQPPLLVNNSGLKMWEGGCALISTTNLGAIDADIPVDTITYKVTGNWWGHLVTKSNSTALHSFTQNQLEHGIIYFNHTNGTLAKFTFRLTDGTHTSKEHIFTIETKPVVLTVSVNARLHVFPLNRQVITADDIKIEASDVNRTVTYQVVKPPVLGRIVMESEKGNFYTAKLFSQNDINVGKIFYEHTHPFEGLYANDSVVFDVNSRLTPGIKAQKFNIDISVSSGQLDSYVSIVPITVDEGGLATIQLNMSQVVHFLENHANLHAPIIHATLWPPKHGSVHVDANSNITTFTQAQFDANLVKYQHDHSDTLNDTLRFTLYLLPDYITLCSVDIPITINPINDQPFKLITQAPSMNVVFGENATITKDLLLTEDPDTPPELLEYNIINFPTEGKLVLIPDTRPVITFSQRDINNGHVVYIHSGSNTTVSFHFRVWDGKFKPVYTLFNIQITPVKIVLTSGSPLFIQQGLNVAIVSTQHIQVKTNVDASRVVYNVTKAPAHGTIYVQDIPRLSFTHSDLLGERVLYMQTDMNTWNDTFRVSAGVQTVAVSNLVKVLMLVQPLMQRRNFTALIGKQNKIGLGVLDATPLAKLTSSNPRYKVVRKPMFGTLHKIIRYSGDRKIFSDQEVESFTHEELRSGLIYYVAGAVESLNGIEDLISFILSASIFQPAYGELRVRILSDRIEPELKRHRGGMHIASPNMSSDYFPIIIMVMGVVVLGIGVIVIIKCRSVDMIKEEPRIIDGCQQPIPLPRPPDHLMASTPHLKRYISEEIALPTHISLPHCKVTPLGPVESSLASSELDVHSRYPYGSAEDGTIMEDWCGQDTNSESTSQPPPASAANPLLRRNQYWV